MPQNPILIIKAPSGFVYALFFLAVSIAENVCVCMDKKESERERERQGHGQGQGQGQIDSHTIEESGQALLIRSAGLQGP